MTSKAGVCVLLLMAGTLFMPRAAKGQGWISDREMAADLAKNGVGLETDRAALWFEDGVLRLEEMIEFSNLVNQGILDIEAYLGVSRTGGRKIRYYISTQVEISHSTWRSVYLPMSRVRRHSAPYLHETAHVVAPCNDCPMWFTEGLASYVQSYVSEHSGGYDGGIFSRQGNRGIDQSARRWLAQERGLAVVPCIGTPGEPPAINYDRSNVAAPFYVMAQSFVKFLVETATLEKLRPVFEAQDFDAELLNSSGKSAAEWKELWQAELAK